MELNPRYLSSVHWLGWVSEPDVTTRGTWDILQSCVVAIFFCTATSLHLNIPNEMYGDWRRRWTRFCWMTVNTLAPEIFMCIAMSQFLEAKIVLRKIDKYCDKYQELNPQWDITQAFYFNMGAWKFKLRKSYRSRHGHKSYLDSKQLKMKHLEAIIRKGLLPQITKDTATIMKYSKQDRLAKAITLAQALRLLIQTFSRMAQHLPTSPLEVTAVAYISCTFFSWLLWFHKPQGVGFSNEVTDRLFEEVFHESCTKPGMHSHDGSDSSGKFKGWKNQLPNIRRNCSWPELVIIGMTWCFTAALFGGLHNLAWNYEFPTVGEQILWRVSSILIVVLPPAFYLCVLILPFTGPVAYFGTALAILYIVARSYNFLEVFFSLRATPELLYKRVHWTNLFPHF